MKNLILATVLILDTSIVIGCGGNPVGEAVLEAIPEVVKTEIGAGVSKFGKNIGGLTPNEKRIIRHVMPEYAYLLDQVRIEVNPLLHGSASGAVTGSHTISFPDKGYRHEFPVVLHEFFHLTQIQSIYGGSYNKFITSYNSGARRGLEAECEGAEFMADIVTLAPDVVRSYWVFEDISLAPDGFYRGDEKISFTEVARVASKYTEGL